MRLSLKITLILFVVISLFIVLISFYFYSAINNNFSQQTEKLMLQSTILIEQRIELLKENLQIQMEQLASSLFTENEATLAAMLATSPDYTTEVVGFAEKLRRRTGLHFLCLISADGTILSDSLHPASFGRKDARADFPMDEPAYVLDESARLELERRVTFGSHVLYLRGGYFVKQNLQRLPVSGVRMEIMESNQDFSSASPDGSFITRTLEFKDYKEKPVVRIRVAVSRQDLEKQKQELIQNSMIFIAGSLLVCLLTGYFFSLSISRPVARLQDAAQQMTEGNLDVRVEPEESGEIGNLMRAFNRMAEQLQENQKKLLQAERIAAWEEIARHLAHEIKNPLTPIRTSIANLRLCLEKAPEKFPEIFLESSESILEEVEKLRRLADEFSRFARLPAPHLMPGNLNEVIQKSILLYSGVGSVQVRFEPGDLPPLAFDAAQMSEVMHNLLQNAADAVESNGMIRVSTTTWQQEGRLWACLTVEDNGRGMDEQTRRQIFTPYFTTKEKGTGLGLTIVHRIITEHGGSIYIESESGKGTKFEVRLPVG